MGMHQNFNARHLERRPADAGKNQLWVLFFHGRNQMRAMGVARGFAGNDHHVFLI